MIKDKKDTKPKKTKKSKNIKKNSSSTLKKELQMVKWPSFKDIVKYTLATIVFCIILVIFFEILNLIMAYVKGIFN